MQVQTNHPVGVKEFSPHIVVWNGVAGGGIQEFSYKEDADTVYEELVQKHTKKVTLAKVVKSHGEG